MPTSVLWSLCKTKCKHDSYFEASLTLLESYCFPIHHSVMSSFYFREVFGLEIRFSIRLLLLMYYAYTISLLLLDVLI